MIRDAPTPNEGYYTLIDSLRVSVVMPAYNEETVIGAILDRLRAVKEVDEIIVVDDGSKDNTPQVAATYEGVRVVRPARLIEELRAWLAGWTG